MLSCMFGLLIEEITMATACFNPTARIIRLRQNKEYPEYNNLSALDKKKVKKFIEASENADNLSLKTVVAPSVKIKMVQI